MILRLVIFNFIIAFFSLKSQTVFSNFNNNPLNFEILQSSNYKLSLLNGNYEILSYSKNGIVSFFYIDTVSRIKNISVTINNTKIKNECKTGLIFDFVDWKNYGYFLISDKFYYIGYVKQGVYSELVDSKHSSFISSTGNDLEITINDFEAVFSVNNRILYKTNYENSLSRKIGVAICGEGKIEITKVKYLGDKKTQSNQGNKNLENKVDLENLIAKNNQICIPINRNSNFITINSTLGFGQEFFTDVNDVTIRIDKLIVDDDNDLVFISENKLNKEDLIDGTQFAYLYGNDTIISFHHAFNQKADSIFRFDVETLNRLIDNKINVDNIEFVNGQALYNNNLQIVGIIRIKNGKIGFISSKVILSFLSSVFSFSNYNQLGQKKHNNYKINYQVLRWR